MSPLPATLAAVLVLALSALASPAEAARKKYVAPPPGEGLNAKNQNYLIGIISFAVVVIATIMAVTSMMNINYDDDTLLMVEVPDNYDREE